MKPKTVRQILNLAESHRYYTMADYNRVAAFTIFMKQMEKKAKEQGKFFQIITAEVVKAQCRHLKPKDGNDFTLDADEKTEMKAMKFVRFAYEKETFYMQFDSNPFFPAYILKNGEIDLSAAFKKGIYEVENGRIAIFDDKEYGTITKYNGIKNIKLLVDHLWEKFKELQKQEKRNFWNPKEKTLEQHFYTR